jgi:5-hydroxyisourate hydrolase
MITSHVLDTALGRPAAGLTVRLDVEGDDGGGWHPLGTATTDQQGRLKLGPAALEARTYRLTFETGPYLTASGRPAFYPRVEVIFTVLALAEHHHIPLLLSPFGYSTYRGT